MLSVKLIYVTNNGIKISSRSSILILHLWFIETLPDRSFNRRCIRSAIFSETAITAAAYQRFIETSTIHLNIGLRYLSGLVL